MISSELFPVPVRAFTFLILLAVAACGAEPGTVQAPAPVVALPGPSALMATDVPASTSSTSAASQPSSEQIPVEASDAIWGNPTAAVTIVAFLDLQCPFCGRVQPTLTALQNFYGPQRLRLVVKHQPLPFHPQARPAAEAAQAVLSLAGPEAFFRYIAILYGRQAELGPDLYARAAAEVGVPRQAFLARAGSAEIAAQVDAHLALADRIGNTGTPGFRINGVILSGAQPEERFRAAIDDELEQTRRAALEGTPLAQIYQARVAKNFKMPERSPDLTPPPDTKVYKVEIGRSPVLGPSDALVTIVEFQDLQCPFCARVQPTIGEIRKRYPTDVRVVFKHNPLPFHPQALPAAMLAVEVRALKGDKAFWDAVGMIFDASPLDEAKLVQVGQKFGLAEARTKKLLARTAHPQVEADQDQAADFDARGTPHFFINGRRLSGAQPLERFTELIDAELAKARELVSTAKVPRPKVYDEIMKTAEPPPAPEQKSVPAPSAKSPSRGPAGAPVVIQIFSDFQCPFCKRVLPTLEEVEKKYPGRVRLVWRDLPLPFHQHAHRAAQAAREAFAQKGSKGFWAMHTLLFENQGNAGGLEDPALENYAQSAGLDLTRFRAALADGRHAAAIDADAAIAKAASISGTPGFVINGYFVSGAQPLRAFTRVVDRALRDQKPKALSRN